MEAGKRDQIDNIVKDNCLLFFKKAMDKNFNSKRLSWKEQEILNVFKGVCLKTFFKL